MGKEVENIPVSWQGKDIVRIPDPNSTSNWSRAFALTMHAIAWFTATQKDLVFFQRVTIFYLIYILFVEITLNYDLWMCNSAILRWMYTEKKNESKQDYLP